MLITLRGLRVNSITTSTALNIKVTSMKEMTNKYRALGLLNKFSLATLQESRKNSKRKLYTDIRICWVKIY